MQASLVTALLPVTTTVPVTFLILSDPPEIPNSIRPTKRRKPSILSKPATIERQHQPKPRVVTVNSNLISESATANRSSPAKPRTVTVKANSLLKSAKTVPQPKPRTVTVKANSLLKCSKPVQKCQNSLLKPVTTTQTQKSLLKPLVTPPDNFHKNPVITPHSKKSLLKPMIVSQETEPNSIEEEVLCEKCKLIKNSNNHETIGNMESCPTPTSRTVNPAKEPDVLINLGEDIGQHFMSRNKGSSVCKSRIPKKKKSKCNVVPKGVTANELSTVNPVRELDVPPNLGEDIGQHFMSISEGSSIFESGIPSTGTKKSKRNDVPKDVTANEPSTLSPSTLSPPTLSPPPPSVPKPRRRYTKEKTLFDIKDAIRKTKDKLHYRYRRLSSAAEKVDQLKELISDLNYRYLLTYEGKSQLDTAVNRLLTILKHNF